MNLHCKLRQETKEHHTKIEAVPLLKKIMAANITLAQYQILLQGFYGFIAPCETIIKSLLCHFLLASREKSALLETDLLALGMGIGSILKLKRCAHLPELYDYEHVIGYLYVLEGSTLGGQVITNMLKKHLQLTPDKGALYFYGYGKNTVAKWDAFCLLLNEIKEEQHTKIITSAHQTYTKLYDWMLEHDAVYTNHQEKT